MKTICADAVRQTVSLQKGIPEERSCPERRGLAEATAVGSDRTWGAFGARSREKPDMHVNFRAKRSCLEQALCSRTRFMSTTELE